MPSFGPALRHARQQQGISLDDVARDTRLGKRYVLALEDESIHELPGRTYNRAYVRTYAGYLGLNPDRLVADYALEEEAQTNAGRLAAGPDVVATMRLAAERPRSQSARSRNGLATVTRAAASAGVVVALLVGLTWVGSRRFKRGDETVPAASGSLAGRTSGEALATRGESPSGLRAAPPDSQQSPSGAVDRHPTSPKPPLKERRTAGHREGRPASDGAAARTADKAGAPRLLVTSSGVGTDVVEQQLVGRSDTFPVGARVAFWTHVSGGRRGDSIRHVWSHRGRKASAVVLPLGGPSWRTQSRKTLLAEAEGDWVVEAQDSKGRALARHEFRCAPR
jgi:cytoskeletal protein RodZ